jgi:hypothetical protein
MPILRSSIFAVRHRQPLVAGGPLVAVGLRPVPVSVFIVSCAITAVAVAGICLHR